MMYGDDLWAGFDEMNALKSLPHLAEYCVTHILNVCIQNFTIHWNITGKTMFNTCSGKGI